MEEATKLELHYYFHDNSHSMDAHVRNKCEAELLAIIHEIALEFGVKLRIDSEAYKEGGLKDTWKFLGTNGAQISIIISLLALISSRIPVSDPELDNLKKEETRLSIQEKHLQIDKLKKELLRGAINPDTVTSAADAVEKNLKVVTRRSNFYKIVNHCHKIKSVGFTGLDSKNNMTTVEQIVKRDDFHKFVLHSDLMPSLIYESEKIEIVSPVLRQGDYKWRGIFNGNPISFTMLDRDFKQEVLQKKISFQNGSTVECVLKLTRKLNEVGEVIPQNYIVETVIEKIDGESRGYTSQGKRYLLKKMEQYGQGDLFSTATYALHQDKSHANRSAQIERD